MRTKAVLGTLLLSALALVGGEGGARAAVAPHPSHGALPAGNGRATFSYDASSLRITSFLEHPYRSPGEGRVTRNFAYDAYPGVRVGADRAWLTAVAASKIEYVAGTGIVHIARNFSGVEIDEYEFAPIGLAENAVVTLVAARRASGSGSVHVYQLWNFRMGAGQVPSSSGEGAQWNVARDCFYEYGGSGSAIAYGSIGASSRHGMTPDNPFAALNAGVDLSNNDTTSATSDIVPGIQKTLGELAVGATGWAGFYAVLSPDNDAQSAADRTRAWIAGRAPEDLLAAEIADYAAWRTPSPSGLTDAEKALDQQAQAVLRMSQVREPGKANGQILASLAPGERNVAWVRDMAYATSALARTGHLAEAKATLVFQLGADASRYESEVGRRYKISVQRYFGEGREDSETDASGPTISLDGFGLFLWSLDEYLRASSDRAWATTVWPTVRAEVADVLVAREEPTGLVAPDASNRDARGAAKRRFAYTTIAAAHGLCAAARIADRLADPEAAATYRAAGQKARDALLRELRSPGGALAESVEALAAKGKWLDTSTVEAVNFGLVHPHKATASATLEALRAALAPPSGRGLARGDGAGPNDAHGWVFGGLRAALAFDYVRDRPKSRELLDFDVAHANLNFGLFAERLDPTTADYLGATPSTLGAGAYELALQSIGKAIEPTCGAFADEPDAPTPPTPLPTTDGGTGPAPAPGGSAAPPSNPPSAAVDEAGCAFAPTPSAGTFGIPLAMAALLVARARRRVSARRRSMSAD